MECPEMDLLHQYFFETLHQDRMTELDHHIGECDYCTTVISRFVIAGCPSGGVAETLAHELSVEGYELVEQLGEGGMGVVWKAKQLSLNRLVALKLVPLGSLGGARQHERFRLEAEAVARLSHDNIVKVYDCSVYGRAMFYSMELVEGGSLLEKMDGRPWNPQDACKLAIKIANALDCAHSSGIIHRDVKPANILISSTGEPKIADFGVAKVLGQGVALTKTGALVGTVAYMSPEQATGNAKGVGPSSDVYSLGVVLYELLTGRLPFAGDSDEQVRQQIINVDPTPVRVIRPGIIRDLETVCMRCLLKEPHRRFTSCEALSADLARVLAGEPIRSCPAGRVKRVLYRIRRKPLTAGTTALLLLFLGAAATFATISEYRRNLRQREIREATTSLLLEAAALDGKGMTDEALGVIRLAREAVRKDSSDGHLSNLVEEANGRYEEKLRDARMRDLLDEIRIAQSYESREGFSISGSVASYRTAFAEYGIPLTSLGPNEAADLIQSSPIRAHLVAALDDWGWLMKLNPGISGPSVHRLFAIATAADQGNAPRNGLRAAIAGDHAEVDLTRIAGSDDLDHFGPAELVLLSEALVAQARPRVAVKVLLKATWKYTSDFWVNHALGFAYANLPLPERIEAIGYLRTATALRPNSAAAFGNLGSVLAILERYEDAETALRVAIARNGAIAKLHHNLSAVLSQRGRHREAAEESRLAVNIDARFSLARLSLGIELFYLKQFDDALSEIQLAVSEEPRLRGATTALGHVLLAQGNRSEAATQFHASVRTDRTDASAHAGLALISLLNGDHKEAARHLQNRDRVSSSRLSYFDSVGDIEDRRSRLQSNPADSEASIELTQLLLLRGNITEAERVIASACEKTPLHAPVHYYHAMMLAARYITLPADSEQYTTGRTACERSLRKVIEIDNEHGEAHAQLGLLILDQASEPAMISRIRAQLIDQAAKELGDAKRLLSDASQACRGMGLVYRLQAFFEPNASLKWKMLEGAREEYKLAVEKNPDDLHCLLEYGDVLHSLAQFADLEQIALKAVRLAPSLRDSHFLLAKALLEAGPSRRDEAVASLRRAIACDADIKTPLYYPHYLLGNELLASGSLFDALKEYRSAESAANAAVKHAPADFNAQKMLGMSRLHQGKYDLAETPLRNAAKLNDSDPDARLKLAHAFIHQNKLTDAEYVIRKVLGQDPGSKRAAYDLGWVLYHQGRFPEAKKSLERYRDLSDPKTDLSVEDLIENCTAVPALAEKLNDATSAQYLLDLPVKDIRRAALLCKINRDHLLSYQLYVLADSMQGLTPFGRLQGVRSAVLHVKSRPTTEPHRERGEMLSTTLRWLRAILADAVRDLKSNRHPAQLEALRSLSMLLHDPELAFARSIGSDRTFSEAERTEWKKVWDEIVEALQCP